MNYQRALKLLIYVIVIAWTVVLYFDHQTIRSALLKPLSTVTSVVLTLAIAFDLWLWRWRIFRGWLVKRPVIDGTWKCEMVSDWRDPQTGAPAGTINGYMVVTQTLSQLTMRLLTKESTSKLIGTEITCAPGNVYCVTGVYENTPNIAVRDRSPIHYGGVWLEVSDDDPPSLTGQYWTDRKTQGPMTLTKHNGKNVKTFAAAKALLG